MTTTPAESDPFFQLLTEALRAGPDSPQWGEAVARLRDGGVDGADEYKLILRAREDIEMGRDFRTVTAGPGFTRKVLDSLEREDTRGSGVPTATIVATLSGLVILGVIVTVIVVMSRGGAVKDPQQSAIERLDAVSMPVSVASGSWPGELKGFEQPAPTTTSTKMSLNRLVTTESLDATVPTLFEAELELPEGGERSTQLFVAPASGARGEILWMYSDGRVTVDVGGTAHSDKLGAAGETLKVSIRFDRELATIDAGGRRLFAGPHRLGDSPRIAGVRFAEPSASPDRTVRIKSISVAQAAPAGGG